jgi:mitochondrial inner membrane protease subunit 1
VFIGAPSVASHPLHHQHAVLAAEGDAVAQRHVHVFGLHGQVGDIAHLLLVDYHLDDGNGIKRLVGMPGDYVSVGTPGERGAERMIQVR